MNEINTDSLKKLLSQCTKGCWEVVENDWDDCYYIYASSIMIGEMHCFSDCCKESSANAELTSLAPQLAAEVLELREQLANARKNTELNEWGVK